MVILIRVLIALINKMDWTLYFEYVGSSLILILTLGLYSKKVYSIDKINRLLQGAVILSDLSIIAFIKNNGEREVWSIQLTLAWSFLCGLVLIMNLD